MNTPGLKGDTLGERVDCGNRLSITWTASWLGYGELPQSIATRRKVREPLEEDNFTKNIKLLLYNSSSTTSSTFSKETKVKIKLGLQKVTTGKPRGKTDNRKGLTEWGICYY